MPHCGVAELSRPPSLLALPSYLAGSMARIGHRHLAAALREHGLGLPHYAVLAALYDFGPLAAHELATRLRTDRSHISTYVETLAQRDWVARDQDPTDRRRSTLSLTGAGHALFTTLKDAALASQHTIMSGLTSNERHTLLALLTQVVARADAQ